MSQWGSSDSGILRKNKADDNFDQLLVFGYSCKIFRDDEKALYIDQGKHLIPWMGDETLKIDRYDGRGTLSDLKQYEASREGYDALRWLGLSESEKKLEELCDSERYYSLEINEEEEEMYKEEVAKRQKTNAFAFDYNNPQPFESDQKDGIPTVPEKEEEDEPYVPSPVLDVPVDINMPKTVKEYARIEKTALFVCRQGPQMEILIKAKQADNPQFSFLTVQDSLYKFYRHVLSAFKNGRYQPQCDNKKTDEAKPSLSQDDQDSHYLHPSLISASAKPGTPPSQNPPIPSVPYRPTADCSYSQLVTRIQGAGLSNNGQADAQGIAAAQQQSLVAGQTGVASSQMQIMSQMNLEQLYHQYYYVQQFYEYWRHTVINSEQGTMYAGLPLNFSQLDPNMQSYIHQLAWAQFVQHHHKQIQEAQQAQANANSNSYAQIVSNLNKDGGNPYTANVPQLPPPEPTKEEDPKVVASTEEKTDDERTVTLVKYDENEVKKPLLSLAAAYGSGTESDSESSDSEVNSEVSGKEKVEEKIEVYRVPAGEFQTVVDKMAEYVAKNGDQFEEIIKQKGDPRFDFLNEGHEFNKYYRVKLGELKGELEDKEVKSKEPKQQKPKPKKVIAPVSFSIKKPKEEPPKEIKSALPMEDSSDEESYLDNLPSISPLANAATKNVTSNNNSVSQKTSSNPKVIYKIGQPVSTTLPQPKVAQVAFSESNIGSDKTVSSKENATVPVDQSSPSCSKRSENSSKSKSPTTRSKSGSYSPTRVKRSHTPKKRSRSRTKSPVTRKRTKSRSETPSKKSPPRVKDSPKKISQPKDEQKAHTKSKKSPIIDMFDVGDVNKNTYENKTNGVLEEDDPILEMMELEKDEKTAEEKAADAKEKARQLERKRKAAMFLKLKSAQTRPSVASPITDKTEKLSLLRADKSEITSEVNSRQSPCSTSSRRNSDDSVVSIRSTSTSEKSKPIENSVPGDKSRSKSKERSRTSRRSRSKEKRKGSKKHRKTKDKDRSRDRDDDERKGRSERDKKKKSHKRKHSKSKKKSKKHKRSRSLSKSRSRSISVLRSSRSKSRSISEKSHISIDSS